MAVVPMTIKRSLPYSQNRKLIRRKTVKVGLSRFVPPRRYQTTTKQPSPPTHTPTPTPVSTFAADQLSCSSSLLYCSQKFVNCTCRGMGGGGWGWVGLHSGMPQANTALCSLSFSIIVQIQREQDAVIPTRIDILYVSVRTVTMCLMNELINDTS